MRINNEALTKITGLSKGEQNDSDQRHGDAEVVWGM